MNIIEEKILNAADISVDVASNAMSLDRMFGCAIQCIITGASAKGTLSIQASCDPGKDVNGGSVANWYTYEENVVTGGANLMYNLKDVYFKWFRVVFTKDTGSAGVLTVYIHGKGV